MGVGDAQICSDLLDCTVGRFDILQVIGRDVVPYVTPHPAATVMAASLQACEQPLMGLKMSQQHICFNCLGLAIWCQSCAALQAFFALMWPQ